MSRLGLLAIDDMVTTALYFERAAAEVGHQLIRTTAAAVAAPSSDLSWLLLVDPFVGDPGPLRRAACQVIGYVIDAHQQLDPRLAYAKYFDHVFVAQPQYLQNFRALPHPSAHWLPLACDPEIHFVSGLERSIDVGFVGKLGQPGSDRHTTLSRVLETFHTNDWRRRYVPRDMGKVYSSCKIVFNKSINRDLNMRFFEGMAAGALMVTDRIGNGLQDIGRDGEHYVSYDTAEEAIAKIRHYLANDTEREAIARAGQKLILTEHTYVHRLRNMLEVATRRGDVRAPARTVAPDVEALWRSEHMRMSGGTLLSALGLLAEGHLTRPLITNVAVGMTRGIVRPLRQRFQATRQKRQSTPTT